MSKIYTLYVKVNDSLTEEGLQDRIIKACRETWDDIEFLPHNPYECQGFCFSDFHDHLVKHFKGTQLLTEAVILAIMAYTDREFDASMGLDWDTIEMRANEYFTTELKEAGHLHHCPACSNHTNDYLVSGSHTFCCTCHVRTAMPVIDPTWEDDECVVDADGNLIDNDGDAETDME